MYLYMANIEKCPISLYLNNLDYFEQMTVLSFYICTLKKNCNYNTCFLNVNDFSSLILSYFFLSYNNYTDTYVCNLN